MLPTLGHHPSAAPGAELWGCWERSPAVGTVAGVGERGLPWAVGHTWTPTWLTLCPLLPGTVWPSASSTAALASWPALPSSPSWASWRGSRVCPSPRWLSQVSGAAVGWGCGDAALWPPPSKGSVPAGYPGANSIAAVGSHPGGQLRFLPPKTREKQMHAHEY